jgi:hypothetical protein
MYLLTAAPRLLVPRLRAQQEMYILHLVVPPNRLMRTRPHRLERIVRIRERDPSSPKRVAQQRLVCEIVVHGARIGQALEDQIVDFFTGVDDLQAAVGHAEPEVCGCTVCLGGIWVAVLGCESAVFGNPVLGVMWFLERVAHACVACGEDSVALACHGSGIELEVHELVHVLEHHHVAVELHDAVVFGERKGREFAPAVVEARVVGVVFVDGGKQVLDVLLGYRARVEGSVAFGGEGVGVERDEGVFAAVLLERVVEREEAGEVGRVGDEGGPYCEL